MQPLLEGWLAANGAQDPLKQSRKLFKHFSSYENFLYLGIPGITAEWSQEMIDNFYENKRENYLPVKLNGTTFSGHSFRTTVGNTLDSIF